MLSLPLFLRAPEELFNVLLQISKDSPWYTVSRWVNCTVKSFIWPFDQVAISHCVVIDCVSIVLRKINETHEIVVQISWQKHRWITWRCKIRLPCHHSLHSTVHAYRLQWFIAIYWMKETYQMPMIGCCEVTTLASIFHILHVHVGCWPINKYEWKKKIRKKKKIAANGNAESHTRPLSCPLLSCHCTAPTSFFF
jgi:hypothetical protein